VLNQNVLNGVHIYEKRYSSKVSKCVVKCACGNTFETRDTLPEIHVEICSECHPFYTGKKKLVDSAGRIEKFRKKYSKFETKKEKRAIAFLLRGTLHTLNPSNLKIH